MTKAMLEKMGFSVISEYNGRLWHSDTESEFVVGNLRKLKPADLVSKFGEQMYQFGKRAGSLEKVDEIKRALNITEKND